MKNLTPTLPSTPHLHQAPAIIQLIDQALSGDAPEADDLDAQIAMDGLSRLVTGETPAYDYAPVIKWIATHHFPSGTKVDNPRHTIQTILDDIAEITSTIDCTVFEEALIHGLGRYLAYPSDWIDSYQGLFESREAFAEHVGISSHLLRSSGFRGFGLDNGFYAVFWILDLALDGTVH